MSNKTKVEARVYPDALDRGRCRHTGADGRRCTMSAAPGDSLCLPHRQRQQKESDAQALAAELLGPFGEFKTATAVNHALGKLFSLVAVGRIAPRDAAVLAYIGQLLLNSLGAVRREAQLARGYEQWHSLLRRTLRAPRRTQREPLSPALSPPRRAEGGQAEGATLAHREAFDELERAAERRPVEVKVVCSKVVGRSPRRVEGPADAAGSSG